MLENDKNTSQIKVSLDLALDDVLQNLNAPFGDLLNVQNRAKKNELLKCVYV